MTEMTDKRRQKGLDIASMLSTTLFHRQYVVLFRNILEFLHSLMDRRKMICLYNYGQDI